jgi:L-lactate dehydrogenase complex protein LldG
MARHPTDARTEILQKIRSGLAAGAVPRPFPDVLKTPLQSVFTPIVPTPEEQFVSEFTRLGGIFVFCEDEATLLSNIAALAETRAWQQVMCADDDLAQKLFASGLTVYSPETHIESADVCITGCEALIARTGSVLLTSAQPFGRTAPVYYPVHIIVATVSQILPDIEDGLKLLTARGAAMPSMIHLNTGPSRTADIEKTLVVGVHGPGEVILMLVDT